MAVSLIAKYPDKDYIIPNLIETALEEMEHFRDFYKVMQQKGVPLPAKMEPGHYSIN